MVHIKGWGGVKPYWWCDNSYTRAVKSHLCDYLPEPHPYNGIFIKGTKPSAPESIEINSMATVDIININTKSADTDKLLIWTEQIRVIMEDAILNNTHFIFSKEEYFKNAHTYNLQYTWQQLDKKLKHSER